MSDNDINKNSTIQQNFYSSTQNPYGLPGRISGQADHSLDRVTPISSRSELVKNFSVDTLHLTFDVEIKGEILVALHEQKKLAQSADFDSTVFKFGKTDIFSFELKRTGVVNYPFSLKTGDIQLLLSTRPAGSSIPNMALRIGSISCQENVESVLKSFYSWCKFHGIRIIKEKVSRVDICSDLAIAIGETSIDDWRKHITRAVHKTIYLTHNELSGVQIGQSDVVLRVYDKKLEMKTKKSEAKIEFFEEIWEKQDDITRVEFQLRRKFIKEIFPKKSDFKTVRLFLSNIWEYLTLEWFRQSDKNVDRKNRNQGQSKLTDFWLAVQSSCCGTRPRPLSRKRKRLHINVDQLTKQAVGCLLSIVSGLGVLGENVNQVIDTSIEIIKKGIIQASFGDEFLCKYDSKKVGSIVSF